MMAMPSFAFDQLAGMNIPTMTHPVECSSQDQFGQLTWVINGVDYTFEPSEWVYPPTNPQLLAQSGQRSSLNSVAAQ